MLWCGWRDRLSFFGGLNLASPLTSSFYVVAVPALPPERVRGISPSKVSSAVVAAGEFSSDTFVDRESCALRWGHRICVK